jgi:hypothetical protein
MKQIFAPTTFAPGVIRPSPELPSTSSSSSSSLLTEEDKRAIAELPTRVEAVDEFSHRWGRESYAVRGHLCHVPNKEGLR